MGEDKCRHCGNQRGYCSFDTRWSDGDLCAYREYTETEKLLLDLQERVSRLEILVQEETNW